MIGDLTQTQCEHVLYSEVMGRIACDADGKPYIVPIAYVYRKGYIYCRSREGRKIEILRNNPNICFQTDDIENMTNWRSVVCTGIFEELKTPANQKEAMKIIKDRFDPLIVSESVLLPSTIVHPPEIVEKKHQAIYFRFKIEKLTGRFEKANRLTS